MTRLHVIVPARDCMPFLPRCLESIAAQTHRDFTVTVIDDASEDAAQARYVERFCIAQGWRPMLNATRQGKMANLWEAQKLVTVDPDDAVVVVDGDDSLTPDALAVLSAAYDDPECWMTWGSFVYDPDPEHWDNPAAPYPPEVAEARAYRRHNVLFGHPMTWRRFLWDRLTLHDLTGRDGDWFRASIDSAFMFPLMELAGTHTRYLPDVIYRYNHTNPLSHVHLPGNAERAQLEAEEVAGRPIREAIPDDHVANPRRKRNMLTRLRDRYGLGTLVETGTGMGDLLEWCWRYFDRAVSIEFDPTSAHACRARFAATPIGRVQLLEGDSGDLLPRVLSDTGPAVVFLDAHFSGGTARPPVDTPVRAELGVALDGKNVVVIDDARLFGTDPAYPTLTEVARMTTAGYTMAVEDDMIVLEPR